MNVGEGGGYGDELRAVSCVIGAASGFRHISRGHRHIRDAAWRRKELELRCSNQNESPYDKRECETGT